MSNARGADLLDELEVALCRYLIFPSPETVVAVVLWIAATHVQPAWQHATRLVIKSPEKRCGKSRLLDLIEALCNRPLVTVNASVSAIFRSIDKDDPPTLLIDEADSIFGKKNVESSEDLRGLLNAGFQRGRPTMRCVGPSQQPTAFETFAMAALAGIGDVIPDTIIDRAIVVAMRRRGPGEHVAPYRHRRDAIPLGELGRRLHKWARGHLVALEHATPDLPVEDRAADTWEPLVAIADAAGGSWPTRARHAAKKLADAADEAAADESLNTKLLTDLRDLLDGSDREEIASAELVEKLLALAESPWTRFAFTQADLARRMRAYGVRPGRVRPEGRQGAQVRGYVIAHLRDVFARYLPPATDDEPANPASPRVTASQPQVNPVTADPLVTGEGVTTPGSVTALTRQCDAVTAGDTTTEERALELLVAELGAEVI